MFGGAVQIVSNVDEGTTVSVSLQMAGDVRDEED
jgi:hypothetical protein